MTKRKVLQRGLSILLVSIMFVASSIDTFASAVSIYDAALDGNPVVLDLLDELHILEFDEQENHGRILEIEQLMADLGVERLNFVEVVDFIGSENAINLAVEVLEVDVRTAAQYVRVAEMHNQEINTLSNMPLPPSTPNIQFYAVTPFLGDGSGRRVHILIAAPRWTGNHSGIQGTQPNIGILNHIQQNGARTVFNFAANKAIDGVASLIPGASAARNLYSLLSSLTPNTAASQFNLLEATLLTRTVHQFIYMANAHNQPQYFGSANVVHYNLEIISRHIVGGNFRTEASNVTGTIRAPRYDDFANYAIIGNEVGTRQRHSFVTRIEKTADNVRGGLVINPVQFRLPAQAAF